MLVATRAQLVATRAQLEHRIAVLKSELGARADRAARHPHPHPRVRGGVFTKTMGELRGAIHALMGAGGAARATTPSGLHEALREGPAPAQRKSVQSAASRVNSLVKVLEKSESAALSSAQKIERQIERLKNPGATLSAHPRHDRELAQLAAHERRAGAVLASLRLQQDLSGVRCAVPGKAGGGAVSRRYRMYFVLLLLMSFVHVLYLEHTLNVCHLGNLCVFYLGNVCVFDLHRLYMHIHIHTTYTHTYTHIHTYIHTYIHTHTHTYTCNKRTGPDEVLTRAAADRGRHPDCRTHEHVRHTHMSRHHTHMSHHLHRLPHPRTRAHVYTHTYVTSSHTYVTSSHIYHPRTRAHVLPVLSYHVFTL